MLPASQMTLPTEDGDFSEVCAHAGGYVGDLVKLTLSHVMPDPIAKLVGDATTELASANDTWFCGGGQGSPHTTLKTKTKLPILASRKACMSFDTGADYDADEHAALCGRAEADEAASEPDADTGVCVRACERNGVYAQRAALAREQCRPASSRKLTNFDWMQREVERSYVFHQGAWRVRQSDVVSGSELRLIRKQPPCGSDDAGVGGDWWPRQRAGDADQPHALCSDERAPHRSGFEGQRYGPVRFVEVVDLFGCVERRTLKRTVERDRSARSSRQAETPQRLAADAVLGQERFQMRALVLGSARAGKAQSLIEHAAWGRTAPFAETAFAQAARLSARTAYAQAEYYYAVENHDADERASYLWNMRWQARLRRFRMPERDEARGPEPVAASTGADLEDAAHFGVNNEPSDANEACADARMRSASPARDTEPPCAESGSTISDVNRLLIH